MCDPPPDDESHYKGTKFYPYPATNLPIIFCKFILLHTRAEMCRLFLVHMARIALRFVSVRIIYYHVYYRLHHLKRHI